MRLKTWDTACAATPLASDDILQPFTSLTEDPLHVKNSPEPRECWVNRRKQASSTDSNHCTCSRTKIAHLSELRAEWGHGNSVSERTGQRTVFGFRELHRYSYLKFTPIPWSTPTCCCRKGVNDRHGRIPVGACGQPWR
ncbi:unnamed protein product [Rangifer tarandus platyrhynchus]|uniref:Uncharacterized protein n=1 Tax=Rangifer tarandus platyrhynchus TaxID=3082113 RepID=A0AC59YF24_RANTA